ncbi:MAG: hypothetical protein K9N55_05530, partial [Phycisphaerae bacterium]|nr:hypothetical protein [Phycisphaerae bacterium]
MMSVMSRRCFSLSLCVLFVLVSAGIGWASEGDPVVDEDGDIVVQINGKPAQGKVSDDMPTIMFEAMQSGPHQIKNAEMSSAPTIMVLFDSNGVGVGQNFQAEDFETIKDFIDCTLKQGQLYVLAIVALRDEDHGKPFSISVTTVSSSATAVPDTTTSDTSNTPDAQDAPGASDMAMQGPVRLPQGIDVGKKGVSYTVSHDDQGRVSKLDDGAGDRILVEYRYPDETPGLDLWYADGTYTKYDFLGPLNMVSKGRYGELKPDTVMMFDRDTGQQVTVQADGMVVTATPRADGGSFVTTRLPGQVGIRSQVNTEGQWQQGTTQVDRDEQGRPVDVYRAGHKLTSTRYDENDLPVEVTLGSGATLTYQYNQAGQLTELKDLFGGVTRCAYEQEGRLVKTTLPDGAVQTKAFDEKGRLLEFVQIGGAKTSLRYAGEYLVGATLEGLDTQVYLPFDDGAMSMAKSSLTGTWLFEKLDDLGQQIRRTDPLGNAVVFHYDEVGILTDMTDDQGKQLVGMTFEDFNPTVIVTSNTKLQRSYDENGQVLTETSDVTDLTISYDYDDAGIVETLSDSQGETIQYRLDEHGQLIEIESKTAGTIKLSYGVFGLLERLERPNGVVTTWQYDRGGRLAQRTHTLPELTLDSSYKYNQRGQLIQEIREPGDDSTFTYNEAGHWTAVNDWNKDTPFEFDAWGQLIQFQNLKFHYNQAGHMNNIEVLGLDRNLPISCDAMGRLISCEMPGSKMMCDFDWNHRLISMVSPGTEEDYRWIYDGLGRLAKAVIKDKDHTAEQSYAYAFDQLYAV